MPNTCISLQIDENEKAIREAFFNCDDLKIRKIEIGKKDKVKGFVCYIEVNAGNNLMNLLGRMISFI